MSYDCINYKSDFENGEKYANCKKCKTNNLNICQACSKNCHPNHEFTRFKIVSDPVTFLCGCALKEHVLDEVQVENVTIKPVK